MKNKVTALLLAATMAISGTAGAFTVSAADGGTLKLSVTTGDGTTTDDKIPTPWYNRVMATNLMFRSLFLADSNLTNSQPDLAESYEISDDKLTYTIKMKDGLKWSDGEDLTAEDVKFSIETALQAAMINSIYTSAFKNYYRYKCRRKYHYINTFHTLCIPDRYPGTVRNLTGTLPERCRSSETGI